MKIAFFTEGMFNSDFTSELRQQPNRRTEICWYLSLKAYHFCLTKNTYICNDVSRGVYVHKNSNPEPEYDLGIIIIPKTGIDEINNEGRRGGLAYYNDLIFDIRKFCRKVAIMQEGNSTYYQNYTIFGQIWYLNQLRNVDFILCHNEIDVKFFKVISGKPCYVLPTLMIEDGLEPPNQRNEEIMCGGTMCQWYSGHSSYEIANSLNLPIYAPKMGRFIKSNQKDGLLSEDCGVFENLHYLDYMSWVNWIYELSKRKYAVHMMPTVAAGTFSLNCAFLGIPCISNELLDTQRLCFPDLSVNVYDLEKAKKLMLKLKNDKDFYNHCSKAAKENYEKYYSEKVFMEHMNEIWVKELGD